MKTITLENNHVNYSSKNIRVGEYLIFIATPHKRKKLFLLNVIFKETSFNFFLGFSNFSVTGPS